MTWLLSYECITETFEARNWLRAGQMGEGGSRRRILIFPKNNISCWTLTCGKNCSIIKSVLTIACSLRKQLKLHYGFCPHSFSSASKAAVSQKYRMCVPTIALSELDSSWVNTIFRLWKDFCDNIKVTKRNQKSWTNRSCCFELIFNKSSLCWSNCRLLGFMPLAQNRDNSAVQAC